MSNVLHLCVSLIFIHIKGTDNIMGSIVLILRTAPAPAKLLLLSYRWKIIINCSYYLYIPTSFQQKDHSIQTKAAGAAAADALRQAHQW